MTASSTKLRPVAGARNNKKSGVVQRRNKRSELTIETILDAAEEVILKTGVDRVSILDVCNVAGISRGTFYRYFASQDELLEAFSQHKRNKFHHSLESAVGSFDDPRERFAALVDYLDVYLRTSRARQLLLVAPKYALGWFTRIFQDSIVRFQEDLRIVFDAWDDYFHTTLDRELLCELLIRYILSEQLVPAAPEHRAALPERVKTMVNAMIASQRQIE